MHKSGTPTHSAPSLEANRRQAGICWRPGRFLADDEAGQISLIEAIRRLGSVFSKFARHVGGETVEIDGVPLQMTRFDLKTLDAGGNLLIHRTGQQFVSRDHGRFYGGVEKSEDWTGQTQDTNDSPVLFQFPGEPGFASTSPQFDCEQQMVQSHEGAA